MRRPDPLAPTLTLTLTLTLALILTLALTLALTLTLTPTLTPTPDPNPSPNPDPNSNSRCAAPIRAAMGADAALTTFDRGAQTVEDERLCLPCSASIVQAVLLTLTQSLIPNPIPNP